MQHNPTKPDMELLPSGRRGKRYPRLDDTSASGCSTDAHSETRGTAPELGTRKTNTPAGSDDPKTTAPASPASSPEDPPAREALSGDVGQGEGETSPRGNPTQPPLQGGGRAKRIRKPLIQIASLNVRGTGQRRRDRTKLQTLVSWMRQGKTGIVGLQETYQCQSNFDSLEKFNEKVFAFANEGSAHSAGTGFLIHRDSIPANLKKSDFRHEIVIEGRLDTLTWNWGNEEFTIANVYVPNAEQAAIAFLDEVVTKLKRRKVDVILGDWNHVESAEDRLPRKSPSSAIKEGLREVRTKLGVTDTWRNENPGVCDYTYEGTSANKDGITPRSRLDRILTSSESENRATRARIDISLTISDHYPVTMQVVETSAPEAGEPRWKMNLEDLDDEEAMKQCGETLLKCQKRMARDPMGHWLAAKASIKNILLNRQALRRKERGKHLSALRKRREGLTKHPKFTTSLGLQHEESIVRERISNIERAKADRAAESSSARFAEKGEAVNKYWFSIGKSINDSNHIWALKDASGAPITDTSGMAEIARNHHEKLQANPPLPNDRIEAIARMGDMANGHRMTSDARTKMKDQITRKEAISAIKSSQNGKSPGKDGIPYEFYKFWVSKLEDGLTDRAKTPDVANILATVWNDVSDERPAPRDYVEGLMFLLYKKKDRDDIANYRPITLLGCDYKLQTKVYATRLGQCVNNVLHPDQAGFVPGRDILDHVKLAKHVKELCDVIEKDGCLVALDQEKAYDRIDHTYLWKIMEAYGLPDTFIMKIKALYRNAMTSVLLNKQESSPFTVQRGVRQGDPMSCLLFNLAIEPLAESLRRSNLKGISIPGVVDRLIVRLFADDTQLYLSRHDKWSKVKPILDDWCLASTAKFNESKTEFLPMGSPAYRRDMPRTKSLDPSLSRTDPLPPEARFVKNHQPLRILGGIIGHEVNELEVWEPVTSRIEQLAEKWSRRHLTLRGRSLIASFLIQSRAQYMLMTNDPPKEITLRIDRATHKVMWRGKKRGLTTMGVVHLTKAEGGFGVPNFTLRARAARIQNMKKWCAPTEARPLWADIADELIRATSKEARDERATKVYTQTWKPRISKTSNLPTDIQRMIKESYRYQLRLEALKIAPDVKDKLPVWLSKTTELSRKDENSAAMRLLRRTHRVQTLGDIRRIVRTANGCRNHTKCMEAVDRIILNTTPRTNIRMQTPFLEGTDAPDGLDFTPRRIKASSENRVALRPVDLNPDVTLKGDIEHGLRLFGTPPHKNALPAYRTGRASANVPPVEIWTDGSATDYGKTYAEVGFGVWCRDNPLLRISSNLWSEPRTNNRAELMATIWAAQNAPPNTPLIIYTDSMYVVTGLTKTYSKWEDEGWLNVENADAWKTALFLIRTRTAVTTIAKVKAHSGIDGNEKADEMAKIGASSADCSEPDLEVPERWTLNGARLQALDFKTTYQWVRVSEPPPKGTMAKRNIARILRFLDDEHGIVKSEKDIWMSLRDKSLRREVSDFLWIAIHGRTQCGHMFKNWGPDWEDLQYCECGTTETIEHILQGCPRATWVGKVWKLALNTLKKAKLITSSEDDLPCIEAILAAAMKPSRSKVKRRAWSIIISETAFCIWRVRNRKRFDNMRISFKKFVVPLWKSMIEKRARTDLATTRLRELSTASGTLRSQDIKATWEGIISLRNGTAQWILTDPG